MSISAQMREKIAARDVKSVRRNLVNYLMVGEGFRTFDEALEEVQHLLPEVMEIYDGKPLNEEASAWDKDTVASAQIALMANFSQERIRHLKRMIRQVYAAPRSKQSTTSSGRTHTCSVHTSRALKIGGGVAVGLGILGLVARKSPLSLALVLVIGGLAATVYALSKENKSGAKHE